MIQVTVLCNIFCSQLLIFLICLVIIFIEVNANDYLVFMILPFSQFHSHICIYEEENDKDKDFVVVVPQNLQYASKDVLVFSFQESHFEFCFHIYLLTWWQISYNTHQKYSIKYYWTYWIESTWQMSKITECNILFVLFCKKSALSLSYDLFHCFVLTKAFPW